MKRKRSREIAMELLFSMEISKNSYEETIECFVEDYEMDLKTIDLEYIKEVMKSVGILRVKMHITDDKRERVWEGKKR